MYLQCPWQRCALALPRAPQTCSANTGTLSEFICTRLFSFGARVPEKTIPVPESRFNELLQAEIAYLETVPSTALSMQDVFHTRDPMRMAKFILSDNPKRIAFRIRLIESLSAWTRVPDLVDCHADMSSWYRRFRLAPQPEDDLKAFIDYVKDIQDEGREIVPRISLGMSKLRSIAKDEYDDTFLNKWMDSYFLSRTGSNMLLDHLIASAPLSEGGHGRRFGIVSPHCNPSAICKRAAKLVSYLCRKEMGHSPPFTVETFAAKGSHTLVGSSNVLFSYIPDNLYYIMRELIKNSFHATVKNFTDNADVSQRPVQILVSSDDQCIVIRVSDRAGGIPSDVGDRIWSYLHGAAAKPGQDANALAGYGVGLPLSRLYARYLGGQLEIRSFPGFGTDAYLMLPRIDTEQVEQLPNSWDLAINSRSGFPSGLIR